MNAAIFRRTVRDAWWLLLLVPLAIAGFEVFLVFALGELGNDVGHWVSRRFVRRFVTTLLGAEFGDQLTATGMVSIGFAHPFMYAASWALLLTLCTRVTVAEVERGTSDLLLALPVSRAAQYFSTSLVWLLAGIPIVAAPWVGVWIGQKVAPLWEPVDLPAFRYVVLNLAALYLAIGGVTTAVSTWVNRRGAAIGGVLAWLLLSFVLNFLATIWTAAEKLAPLGLLHYYKPLLALNNGGMQFTNTLILAGLGGVAWLLGLWRWCRRDMPAP